MEKDLEKKKVSIHVKFGELSDEAYVRQAQLIPGVIPISPATLWRKVSENKFPRPLKLSERVTAWRVKDIRAWLKAIEQENA